MAGPLQQLSEATDPMLGADAPGYGAQRQGPLSSSRGLPQVNPRSQILDQATDDLLRGMEGAPYQAAAAAVFSQNRPGSLPAAVGAGMGAKLETQLFQRTKPYDMARDLAATQFTEAETEHRTLQNEIDRLNLEYYTNPWDMGGGSPLSDALIGGGDGQQGGSGTDDYVNPDQLPLTPEGQGRMDMLKLQLDRALEYANRSPAARDDIDALLGEMTKLVAEDPLAKRELESRKKTEDADVDLRNKIKESVLTFFKDSEEQARTELQNLMSSPNSQLDPNDLAGAERWVDARARRLFAQRYQQLEQQLEAMHLDPADYLSGLVGQDGTELAGDPGGDPTGGQPTQLAPDPSGAPAVTPGLAPAQDPNAGPARVPGTAAGPPVQPLQLKPGERDDLLKLQGEINANRVQLQNAVSDLTRALDLNQASIGGGRFFQPLFEAGHAFKSGLKEQLGGDAEDPALTATGELQSILSSTVLQNLSTLIKGNPTEGERAYVERLSATTNMPKATRDVLIRRAIKLLQPRLEFMKLMEDAAIHNQTVDPNAYERWLVEQYGPAEAEKIRTGKGVVEE